MVPAIGTGGQSGDDGTGCQATGRRVDRQSGRRGRSAHLARPGDGRLHVAGPLGEARRHRLTAVSAKGGVDAAEKVSANQIVGVRVRFNPETHYERGGGSRVATRALSDTPIEWEEWKGEEKKKKKKKEEGGIGQHGN